MERPLFEKIRGLIMATRPNESYFTGEKIIQLLTTKVAPYYETEFRKLESDDPAEFLTEENGKIVVTTVGVKDVISTIVDRNKGRPLSRPRLTRVAIEDLITLPSYYFAYREGFTDQTPNEHFFMFSGVAYWAENSLAALVRAEGVIARGARSEVFEAFPEIDPFDEAMINQYAERFEDHAQRLINDKTGISVLEGQIIKTLGCFTGIRTVGSIGSYQSPREALITLAGDMVSLESYRRVYPHTEQFAPPPIKSTR